MPGDHHPVPASGPLHPVTVELPGVVLSVAVGPGTPVDAGDELGLVESMKMEIPVVAPAAGTVTSVHVGAGDPVGRDDPLVTVRATAGGPATSR